MNGRKKVIGFETCNDHEHCPKAENKEATDPPVPGMRSGREGSAKIKLYCKQTPAEKLIE